MENVLSKSSAQQRWLALYHADGLTWQAQVIFFFIAALLVFSRRPDVLWNAQFYAEDGAVWFADAYNIGWLRSLLIPAGGYLNTLPRLVAAVALLAPLQHAPLVMNLFGIVIEVLPAWFLLTARAAAWGSLPLRAAQVILYLAIPNSREVHVVLTNAQFHFALLSFLVAVASPPPTWRWKFFDIAVLLICGLTGPFAVFLLPVVVIFWWKRRQRWSLVVLAVVIPTIAIQLAELLFGGYATRASSGHLGASLPLFFRLLAGQVYIASIIGENSFAVHLNVALAAVAALAGSALVCYCLLKAKLELRLLIVLAFGLFAAALARPLVASDQQWQVMTTVVSMRYWFFPMLAFLWCVLWCANHRSALLQLIGICALMSALIGVRRDWVYPPYKDENFSAYVEKFNQAPAGADVSIPVFPDGVFMRLRKKNP